MLKKVDKSKLEPWVKTVEVVEVTDEHVLGLMSDCVGTTPIMTEDYEKPVGLEVGDVYLYKNFRLQPPAAPVAPADSPFWNDPKNYTFERHSGILLILE